MSTSDEAAQEIRKLAAKHNLAVSIVGLEDVLVLHGINPEDATPEQEDAVLESWEWRHYGDNWNEWFDQMEGWEE